MSFCTACGRQRSGSARYCTACGAPFPEAASGGAPVTPKPAASPPVPGPDTYPGTVTADAAAGGATAAELAATPAADRPPVPLVPDAGGQPETLAAYHGPAGLVQATGPGTWPARSSGQSSQPGPHPQDMPPGGTGPGAPGWQQQPPARRSRARMAGIALVALAVTASAVFVTVAIVDSRKSHGNASSSSSSPGLSSSPPSSPQPSPSSPEPSSSPTPATSLTAESEATTVSNLLSSSAQSRLAWNSTLLVTDVGQCINIGNDIQQIQQIASQRMNEYDQARNLQTGAIQNGERLKSELTKALLASLNIDNEYLRWAQQQMNSGCTVGTNSAYYSEANASDTTATSDKATFVNTWNPIAQQYGLQQFSASQI